MLLGGYGRALLGRDRDAVEGLGTLERVDDWLKSLRRVHRNFL